MPQRQKHTAVTDAKQQQVPHKRSKVVSIHTPQGNAQHMPRHEKDISRQTFSKQYTRVQSQQQGPAETQGEKLSMM